MLRTLKILFFLFITLHINAQEIDCTVVVNSDKVPGSNKQIFKTLEKSINEFVNQTRWTNKNFKTQEKINCSFTITILEQVNTNNFSASIQVQASRPIYNSNYLSPLLNMKDGDFNFTYTEFETLENNENSFQSNLVSVLTFYVYTILGFDADSFKLKGGIQYFEEAENIVNISQQSEYKGWNLKDGDNTRYQLIKDLLASRYGLFHEVIYNYHRKGLDTMTENTKKSKNTISKVITQLIKVKNIKRNSFLIRIFMDAKAEEITSIYKDGPDVDVLSIRENLIKLSPTNLPHWNTIK